MDEHREAKTMLGLIILLIGCMRRENFPLQTIEKVLSNLQNQSEAEELMDLFIVTKGKVPELEVIDFSENHSKNCRQRIMEKYS